MIKDPNEIMFMFSTLLPSMSLNIRRTISVAFSQEEDPRLVSEALQLAVKTTSESLKCG